MAQMQRLDPLRSEAPLIVYLDVKSPYAFVAVKPTLELEARLGTRFDWRPLTLDIPSYLGSARKKRGKVVKSQRSHEQWVAVRYAYRDTRRYAEAQGHVLRGTEKIWDSSIANIGILWTVRQARERLADYLQAVYPPFWNRELDIEDVAVVQGCLQAAGVPAEGFAEFNAGDGRAQHDALMQALHPAGIFGVPGYVFEGEYLFGRENLPYIEWRLRGRQGPAPDIAVRR